jgi:hypothetical protein
MEHPRSVIDVTTRKRISGSFWEELPLKTSINTEFWTVVNSSVTIHQESCEGTLCCLEAGRRHWP